MLTSAIKATRSAVLHAECCKQLNIFSFPCFLGTNFRFYNAQSSPDANSTDPEKKEEGTNIDAGHKDTKDCEYDRLIEEKDALLKDLQDKYKRSLADNENILSRSRKQIEEAKLFGIQSFSKDLLEVADILGKATETVPKEEIEKSVTLKNLYDGLLMTEAQLQKVFKKNGLEKINPINEKFDPYSHEALFQLAFPDKDAGTVGIVEKVGYKLNGRTLRPALVGVVKE